MSDTQKFSGRVAVTGASSFVGCHLAAAFAGGGAEVAAIHSRELDAYDPIRRKRVEHACTDTELVRLDIRDGDAAASFLRDFGPDIWIHHVGYTDNYTSPDFDWIGALDTTAQPLATLYEIFAETGTKVIVSGTDQEYGAASDVNREDDPCLPVTPYGLSKLSETLAARQLAARFSVPTRIARVYIPFGKMDNPKKLLPQVVEALAAGRKMDLSAGTQRRDFVGVADLCRGYLALANDMDRAAIDVFNIASGVPVSLRELLETLCKEMNADPALLNFGAMPMRPGEPPLSAASIDKAKRLLGFAPRPLGRALAEDLLA